MLGMVCSDGQTRTQMFSLVFFEFAHRVSASLPLALSIALFPLGRQRTRKKTVFRALRWEAPPTVTRDSFVTFCAFRICIFFLLDPRRKLRAVLMSLPVIVELIWMSLAYSFERKHVLFSLLISFWPQ